MSTASGEPAEVAHTGLGPETELDPSEQQMRSRLRDKLFGEASVPIRIGRFVVLHEIGSGGLGVVYAAYDPELDRKVALKLIHPARTTPRAVARMQREAQAMARLTHPNVVAVHDVGPHHDGVFIAMELVDGMTLSKWVRAHAPPWKTIRDVLVSAGEGVAAAHAQGLVHRDFKPANVLVDRTGRARVLDFGLARAAEDRSVDEPSASTSMLGLEITQSGAVLGTPAYMAPEQFDGRADPRSDQWGFCVTAFEALYGERPFAGRTTDDLREAIAMGDIPLPPAGSKVPPWMHRVLSRGLSYDPDARHPSMAALLHAMQRDRRSRRLQWLALIGALVLALTTGAVTAFVVQPEPSAEAKALVQRLETEARNAADHGHFVYPPAEAPDTPTALLSVLALERLEGPVAEDAKARAELLRHELAERLVDLGDDYQAKDGGAPFAADFYAAALVFDPDHERARARSPLTPGELATLREKASDAEFTEIELSAAEPLAALAEPDEDERQRKVAALLRRDRRRPAASTEMHLEQLLDDDTRRLFARDRTLPAPPPTADDEAVPSARGEAEPGKKPSPPSKRDTASAQAEAKAGRAALRAGNDAEAERAFHRALGKDNRNHVALAGLSDLYFERGAYQKALRYADKAVAVAPKRAAYRMQLGDAYFKVHRYGDAREQYQVARKLGHPGAERALQRVRERVGGPG